MESYDGAEVCELVGLFMLNNISEKLNKPNIGLYRDDGLAVLENANGHQIDNFRKKLTKIFKDHNLKITIICNIKTVDFLDITFDLLNNSFKPYSKPNNNPRYVNINSNHPPSIIKQIPKSVEKRINNNSCNKEVFDHSANYYNNILSSSGYKEKIKFNQKTQTSNNKNNNRRRNIIWYNPPYSKNVKTNVGSIFLRLLRKHFPKNHRYNKIFNKNNVKISYSCMPNMKQIINSHNKNILNVQNNTPNQKTCNCEKEPCPLNGNCLVRKVVYRADVKDLHDNTSKVYLGISEPTFKVRYSNHKNSFKYRKNRTKTELSKHIWDLKDKKHQFEIKWSIVKECGTAYNPVSKSCNLCLSEKFLICTFKDKKSFLNKKS